MFASGLARGLEHAQCLHGVAWVDRRRSAVPKGIPKQCVEPGPVARLRGYGNALLAGDQSPVLPFLWHSPFSVRVRSAPGA